MDETRRILKRVFIALAYLAVFSGLGMLIYLLVKPKPAPPPAPEAAALPIETDWIKTFNAGPGLYTAAAKIRNPNGNFGASYFDFTFYLYDQNGKLLATSAGSSFIWPGESKYIISGGIDSSKPPIKTVVKIGAPTWHKLANFKGIDLTLGNISYGKGKAGTGKFFSVNFDAINNTPYDLGRVYITAIVLDDNSLPIAAASTFLDNLQSRERRHFEIPWFSSFPGTPSRVDLGISTDLWETPALLRL